MKENFAFVTQRTIFRLFLHFYGGFSHFDPTFYFYTPWKRQKTYGFLTIFGGIKKERWAKIG